MDKEKFKIKIQYLGDYKHNCEEHGFNNLVISGPCQGEIHDYKMIGRLVQVRKKSGAYGTDTILIRLMDGTVGSFHNQGFFSVKEEYQDEIKELFKDVELDAPDHEYTIQGKHLAKGFVVHGMDCTNGAIYSFAIVKTEKETKIIV